MGPAIIQHLHKAVQHGQHLLGVRHGLDGEAAGAGGRQGLGPGPVPGRQLLPLHAGEVAAGVLAAVGPAGAQRAHGAGHQHVARHAALLPHRAPRQPHALLHGAPCLLRLQPEVLLEALDAGLVAAGDEDPRPGGEEVPVDTHHALGGRHEAASRPQRVGVHHVGAEVARELGGEAAVEQV
jgi:hypothetical protein